MNEGYKQFNSHEEHELSQTIQRLSHKMEECGCQIDAARLLDQNEGVSVDVLLSAIRATCDRQGGMSGVGNLEQQYADLVHDLAPEETIGELTMLYQAIGRMPESLEEEYVRALEASIIDEVYACEGDNVCIDGVIKEAQQRARPLEISGELLHQLRDSIYQIAFLPREE